MISIQAIYIADYISSLLTYQNMEDFLKGKEYDAIRYRHEDQSRYLQYMASVDLQILSGFLTVQLAFGGFLTQFRIDTFTSKLSLFIIDLVVGYICIRLLRNSQMRRKEVVETIRNCNQALGFNQKGTYLHDGAIDAHHTYRPWFDQLYLGLVATIIGISIILFSPTPDKTDSSTTSMNINLIMNKDTLRVIGNQPKVHLK